LCQFEVRTDTNSRYTSQEQHEDYFNNAEHLKHPESLRAIKKTFQRWIIKKKELIDEGRGRKDGWGLGEQSTD